MHRLYLLLALVGAVVPYIGFFDFFMHNGVSLGGFVSALFVNGAAGGFAADVLLSSVAFWLWLFRQPAGPSPWLFVVLNLTIGLSCALPAYLYAAARAGHEPVIA